MKYKCFCHHDNCNDITKDEARHMLRSDDCLELYDYLVYYNVPLKNILGYMKSKGMLLKKHERDQVSRYRDSLEGAHPKQQRESNNYLNWEDAKQLPLGLVCAIYNVPFEKFRGKYSFDMEEYEKAVEDLQNKIDRYYSEPQPEEHSDLRPIDLVAMRYYRGINRKSMASKLLKTFKGIEEIERRSPVLKSDADAYMDALKIKNRHVEQLRAVMNGTLTKVTEDRSIPKLVKVIVWARDKGKCKSCGRKDKLHYHHIQQFSDGGQHTPENLKLLCVECHAEVHKDDKSYYLLKKMADENEE